MTNEEYEQLKLKRDYVNKNIDGVDYIKSLIKVKKVGGIYAALCPFHSEKTESLRIYPEGYKNDGGEPQEHTSWYCFGCKRGGDIVKFEELYYDFDDAKQACESLQAKFGITFSEDDKELALKQLLASETKTVHEQTKTLQEINFICSIMCRNYLHLVYHDFNDKFDEEFDYVQNIYKKLDYELLERNAKEAECLIKIVENLIKKRKSLLTN
jgi:CHC2 zinc finger domain protein